MAEVFLVAQDDEQPPAGTVFDCVQQSDEGGRREYEAVAVGSPILDLVQSAGFESEEAFAAELTLQSIERDEALKLVRRLYDAIQSGTVDEINSASMAAGKLLDAVNARAVAHG